MCASEEGGRRGAQSRGGGHARPQKRQQLVIRLREAAHLDGRARPLCGDWDAALMCERAGAQPCRCDACAKPLAPHADLTPHPRAHSCDRPYKCSKCDKSFWHHLALSGHQRTHAGKKLYTCDICGKNFGQSSDLLVHQRSHTGEKPYLCGDCDKCFSRSTNLIRHRRTHTGEKPFKCAECDKAFSGKSDLISHQRTHTGERPYKCGKCDKSYRHRSAFIVHKRVHTGEKPYRCGACDKRFGQKSDLIVHQRVHTGEKPYKCLQCMRSFTRSANLIRHQATHTHTFRCLEYERGLGCDSDLILRRSLHVGEERPWAARDGGFLLGVGFVAQPKGRAEADELRYQCSVCDPGPRLQRPADPYVRSVGDGVRLELSPPRAAPASGLPAPHRK